MKKFSLNESVWFMILIGFSYYIYNLLFKNEILYFVHPKMVKFVLMSLIVFIVLAITQIKKTMTIRSTKLKFSYIIFIIPLLLGFTVAPKGLNEEIALVRGVRIADLRQNTTSVFYNPSKGFQSRNHSDLLEIEASNFDGLLRDIKENIDYYEGQKVKIEGFLHRQEHYKENQFVVARLLLTCCAADATVLGLLTEGPQLSEFENYQWVEIYGTLEKTDHYDVWIDTTYIAPLIRIDSIKLIDKPAELYVYPSEIAN